MTTPQQDGSHRRSATRAPVGRPIKLQFDDSMDVIEGHCRNVSIGGMFISFDDARPAGSLVRFELELEDDTAIRGLGEVVWMRSKNEFGGPESGFGLKFRFLEQRDRQLIFKLVSQHIKDRLSKREPAGEEEAARLAPPAASLEQLGVAVPPAPEPPVSPASPAPEPAAPPPSPEPLPEPELPFAPPPEPELPLGPPAPELPFEPPLPVASTPEPATAVRESQAFELPPEGELPAPAARKGLVETGSRPAVPPVDDPFDLDPSVGETPMYELGLEPDLPAPGEGSGTDFELPPRSELEPTADEPAGSANEVTAALPLDAGPPRAEYAARAGGVAVVGGAAASARRFSLLPVGAVALIAIAAVSYLYRDRILARFDGEPAVGEPAGVESSAESVVAATPAATESITPGTAAGASPEARPPETSPSATPAGETEAAATEVVPPPPVQAAPPPPPPPIRLEAPLASPQASASPPAAVAGSAAEVTRVVDISWSQVPGGLKITLTGDGPIPTGRYKYFHLSGAEPREVVKLTGLSAGYPKTQMTIGGPAVQRIRTGFHRGNELHVVMDLAGPRWQVTTVESVGNALELTLTEP